MQRLSETKRSSEDCPKKKRKSSGNDTMHCLQDKASKDHEIQKQTLDVKQKHNKAMAKQSELLMQQQQDMMTNFQQQLQGKSTKAIWADDANVNDANAAATESYQALLTILAKTDK